MVVAIGNCPQYGGGFKIVPQANLADGFFDICFIEDIAKWRILYYLPFVIKGVHGKFLKRIRFYRAKEVIVESPNTYVHLDGEIFKGDRFHFTLFLKRLKIIVPA